MEDAYVAWQETAEVRPPTADIVATAEEFAATDDWRKKNGRYVKLPANWLRAHRWSDKAHTGVVSAHAGKWNEDGSPKMWSREDEAKNRQDELWSTFEDEMYEYQLLKPRPGFDEWKAARAVEMAVPS